MVGLIFETPEYKYLQHFSAYSTPIGYSAKRCKRTGMRVVGKYWSYILFDFAPLRSLKALSTIYLNYLWNCYVRISQGNWFTECSRLNDVSIELVIIYLAAYFLKHQHFTTFDILENVCQLVKIVVNVNNVSTFYLLRRCCIQERRLQISVSSLVCLHVCAYLI